MKSQARQKEQNAKRIRKEHRMNTPGSQSNYALKKAYLVANGGSGFDYPNKPWK